MPMPRRLIVARSRARSERTLKAAQGRTARRRETMLVHLRTPDEKHIQIDDAGAWWKVLDLKAATSQLGINAKVELLVYAGRVLCDDDEDSRSCWSSASKEATLCGCFKRRSCSPSFSLEQAHRICPLSHFEAPSKQLNIPDTDDLQFVCSFIASLSKNGAAWQPS